VTKGGALKAVRLYEFDGPEDRKYEDNVPDPALSDNFVLIEAAAASVNPIPAAPRFVTTEVFRVAA
jgi:NADPH:quinone reductase-like Zn-dependent oxidoreductase